MKHVERLQQAIRDLHGLESEYVVPIEETFRGETLWKGTVDVFRVRGHPQAEHAYAWSYKTEAGELRHVAVLGVPPIDTPQKAVQAAVVAGGGSGMGNSGSAWPGAIMLAIVLLMLYFLVAPR